MHIRTLLSFGFFFVSSFTFAQGLMPRKEVREKSAITIFNIHQQGKAHKFVGIRVIGELRKINPNMTPSELVHLAGKFDYLYRYFHAMDPQEIWKSIKDINLVLAAGTDKKTLAKSFLHITPNDWLEMQKYGIFDNLTMTPRKLEAINRLAQSMGSSWPGKWNGKDNRMRAEQLLPLLLDDPVAIKALSEYLKDVNGNVEFDEDLGRFRLKNPEAANTDVLNSVRNLPDDEKARHEKLIEVINTLNQQIKDQDQSRKSLRANGESVADAQARIEKQYNRMQQWNSFVAMAAGDDHLILAICTMNQKSIELMAIHDLVSANVINGSEALVAVASAGLSLFSTAASLLAGGPISDTERILQAIAEISKQIHELKIFIAIEFSDLRDQLDQLAWALNTRFDLLENVLRGQHQDLRELILSSARSAGATERKIDAMKRDLFTAVSDASMRELNVYHERLQWRTISPEKFNETMDRFKSCAVADSKDTIAMGPIPEWGPEINKESPHLYTDLAALLSPRTEAFNRLNVIADAGRYFDFPAPESAINNPNLWALCVDSYLGLAAAHPDLYPLYDPGLTQLNAILDAGYSTRHWIYAMGREGEAVRMTPIMNLLDAYKEQVTAVVAALDKRTAVLVGDEYLAKGLNPFQMPTELDLPPFAIPNGAIGVCPDRKELAVLVRHAVSPPNNFDGRDKPLVPDYAFYSDQHYKDFMERRVKFSFAQSRELGKILPLDVRISQQIDNGLVNICIEEVGVKNVFNSKRNPEKVTEAIRTRFRYSLSQNNGLYLGYPYVRLRVSYLQPQEPNAPIPLVTWDIQHSEPHQTLGLEKPLISSEEASGTFKPLSEVAEGLVQKFAVLLTKAAEASANGTSQKLVRLTLQSENDAPRLQVEMDISGISQAGVIDWQPVSGGFVALVIRPAQDALPFFSEQTAAYFLKRKTSIEMQLSEELDQPSGDLKAAFDRVSGIHALTEKAMHIAYGHALPISSKENAQSFQTTIHLLPQGHELALLIKQSLAAFFDKRFRKKSLSLVAPIDDVRKRLQDWAKSPEALRFSGRNVSLERSLAASEDFYLREQSSQVLDRKVDLRPAFLQSLGLRPATGGDD